MPLVGDQYEQRTEDDILDSLAAELRTEFGEDIDLTESSVFRTFAASLASLDATEVEPAIEEVHEAGFLDSASGQNLDRLVELLGVRRRDATHATGIIEFRHGSLVSQDYQITNGTIIQTDENDPVEFETTELVTLSLFDDFENGSLRTQYGGDTADFSVVDGSASADPTPFEGSYALRCDATAAEIRDTTSQIKRGSKMAFHTFLQQTDATDNEHVAHLFGVQNADNHYRTRLDRSAGDHVVEIVTPSGPTTLASDTSANLPTNEWLRNEIDWEGADDGRIISRVYDASDSLVSEVTVTGEDEIDVGGFGFANLGGAERAYFDHSAESAVQADARARDGGPSGNVGANTLTVMPTVPAGVTTAANPLPMGDDSYRLTSTVENSTGRPREDDDELRARTRVSEGARGDATAPALIAELSSLPEAESVTVYENKTDSTQNGLPATSFEIVYYGSDPDTDIVDAIFETKGFTAQDVSGVNGTAKSGTYDASNGQTFTVEWSEPSQLDVDMTLDVVVNDTWVGKDAVRDRIVDYVGGTLSDGTSALGTGPGEDVYVDQIEDIVTGPDDTGVVGISNKSFTPATTTDSNGLDVVAVGSDEVAVANAEDGSITINVTRL
jgi:uncharacterized phage protein gp47/JayE